MRGIANGNRQGSPLAYQARQVKLDLAIGGGTEKAVHSHAHRALNEGLDGPELRHITWLAIPALGLPSATEGMTLVDDVLTPESGGKSA